jgi:hypothetical protein
MSLFLATLLPGLLLAVLGGLLLSHQAGFVAALKALPRSAAASGYLFGGAAVWFLWITWHSAAADNFDHPVLLTVGFAAVAVLAFRSVPDFLAVRGLSILYLLAAWHLRAAAYMEYDRPQRLLMVTPLYLGVALAIWLGVQPYRLRDFLAWLLARAGRARGFGAGLLAYGLLLVGVAFTY